MFFNKKGVYSRKGYILIYTMLIGLLTVSAGIYLFSINQMKIFREIEDMKYISKGNLDENYTEKILCDLNKNIIENVASLSKENLTQYIKNSSKIQCLDGKLYLINTINTEYYNSIDNSGKYEIIYDASNDYFIARYNMDKSTFRDIIFSYNINGDTLSFVRIKTVYGNM